MSQIPNAEQPDRKEGGSPRFDRPHYAKSPTSPNSPQTQNVEVRALETTAALSGSDAATDREQLERHATDLAGHLRRQHHDLRRREAAFNARVAQWEAEQRTSHLCLREHEAEIEQRIFDLQRRESQLAERESNLELANQTAELLAERERDLAIRAAQLQSDEQHLNQERELFSRQSGAFQEERREWKKTRDEYEHQLLQKQTAFDTGQSAVRELSSQLREQLEHVEQEVIALRQAEDAQRAKRHRLKSLELMLRRRSSELDQERITLRKEREDLRQKNRLQRDSLAALWKQRKQRMQNERDSLSAQKEELVTRDQTIADAAKQTDVQKREVLEMKLVAEHLRRQLEGVAAPNDWQTAADDLHQWVNSQLEKSDQESSRQHQRLVDLAGQLTSQQEDLSRYREETVKMIAQRARDSDQLIEQLDKRELDMDQRTKRLDEARRSWNRYWLEQQESLLL